MKKMFDCSKCVRKQEGLAHCSFSFAEPKINVCLGYQEKKFDDLSSSYAVDKLIKRKSIDLFNNFQSITPAYNQHTWQQVIQKILPKDRTDVNKMTKIIKTFDMDGLSFVCNRCGYKVKSNGSVRHCSSCKSKDFRFDSD